MSGSDSEPLLKLQQMADAVIRRPDWGQGFDPTFTHVAPQEAQVLSRGAPATGLLAYPACMAACLPQSEVSEGEQAGPHNAFDDRVSQTVSSSTLSSPRMSD